MGISLMHMSILNIINFDLVFISFYLVVVLFCFVLILFWCLLMSASDDEKTGTSEIRMMTNV
ncbi:unnamed protein product [Arabidopsis halleri]